MMRVFDVKRPSRVHTRAAGVSMRQDASRDAAGRQPGR
jgi:hypothetical protein